MTYQEIPDMSGDGNQIKRLYFNFAKNSVAIMSQLKMGGLPYTGR